MLKPNLASHAPSVSMIILIVGIDILIEHRMEEIKRTRLSIIPSRHKRDLRK